MDSSETKVIENRVLHRFVQPIAYYEEGGAYYKQVIGLNTQAYAVYDRSDKSGIYVVYGDGSHTYTEIRDGKSSISYCKEYPVFSEDFVNLISEKADKTDTYTKNEVDAIVSSVYKPKGSVATYNDLPKTGNKVGDVYDVLEDSMNYVWTISDKWDPLGPIIDLTPYAKKTELQAETTRAINSENVLSDRITNNTASTEALDTKYKDITDNLTAEYERLDEEKAGVQTVAQLIRNSETNSKEYTDSQVAIVENLIPDKVSELENDVGYLTEHQSLDGYATEQYVDMTSNDAKIAIFDKIWSKPSDPDNGYFYSKHMASDGSYALIFNEPDGGGSQFFNQNANIISYVGTNDGGTETGAVCVQIYSKDKTTNVGARFNVCPKGMFYTNGLTNGTYTENDEIITKGALTNLSTKEELQTEIKELKAQIEALKLLIPTEQYVPTEAQEAMLKSGIVMLANDIDLSTQEAAYHNVTTAITAKNETTINFNNHNLHFGNARTWGYLIRGLANYTFVGDGVITQEGNGGLVWTSSKNAVVDIYGGEWIANGLEAVYCESGTINIYGGTFRNKETTKQYLLNCKDTNYAAGTAKIIVYGGEFYNFDPSNNPEGLGTTYVAEGYKVTSRQEDQDIIYTVKKA